MCCKVTVQVWSILEAGCRIWKPCSLFLVNNKGAKWSLLPGYIYTYAWHFPLLALMASVVSSLSSWMWLSVYFGGLLGMRWCGYLQVWGNVWFKMGGNSVCLFLSIYLLSFILFWWLVLAKNVASEIAENLCESVATKLEGKVLGTFKSQFITVFYYLCRTVYDLFQRGCWKPICNLC